MSQKSTVRVVAEPLILAVVLACGVRAAITLYAVPSESMLPTLQTGDHIAVTPYRSAAPRRGDVIVFREPADPSQVVVKRVIGLPGDLIDSAAGRVRISGHTLAEPYLLEQASTGGISPQVVPFRSYFVMGDNRRDSVDSRRWGAIPAPMVLGRVRIVLWSSSGQTGAPAANAATPSRSERAVSAFHLSRIFKCVE